MTLSDAPADADEVWYTGRVDHDAAWAFAQATCDPNDVYDRDQIAPPLFTVSAMREAMLGVALEGIPRTAVRNYRAIVHGSHDVRFFAPVRHGMRLRWRAWPHNAYRTKVGLAATNVCLVTDDAGTPLVEHHWGSLFVGGEVDDELLFGPPPSDHLFPESARERPLGSFTFDVPRDQGWRYAGVSGDFNPHAIDDEGAHADGFPSKITQGMSTFAMCSGAVVRVNADGDPQRLRRLAGRLTAPVYPGNPMVVQTYDMGMGEDGLRHVAFEAFNQGSRVIQHGRAEIAPE